MNRRRAGSPTAKLSGSVRVKKYVPKPSTASGAALDRVDARQIAQLASAYLPSRRIEYKIAVALRKREGRWIALRIFLWKGQRHSVRTNLVEVLEKVSSVPGMTAFLVAHNHPSGNLTPSRADFMAHLRTVRLAKRYRMHLVANMVVALSEGCGQGQKIKTCARKTTVTDIGRARANAKGGASGRGEREDAVRARARVRPPTPPRPRSAPALWGVYRECAIVGTSVVPTGRGFVVRIVGSAFRGSECWTHFVEPEGVFVSRIKAGEVARRLNARRA